jgi:replicative DNA helicase
MLAKTALERQVLAAILLDPEQSGIAFTLSVDCFDDEFHKFVFNRMQEFHSSGKEITPFSLLLNENSTSYCVELLSEHSSTKGINTAVLSLKQMNIINSVKAKMVDTLEKMRDIATTPDKVIPDFENCLMDLIEVSDVVKPLTLSEISEKILTQMDDVVRGRIKVLKSGFKSIDRKGWFFRNGTLNVLAGRPGMGKTSLAMKIAINMAKNNLKIIFFSLEMRAELLYERLISRITNFRSQDFFNPEYIKNNSESAINAIKTINEMGIIVDDGPYRSPLEIFNQCKRLKANQGLDFVIIDYLGLMSAGEKTASRREEISKISSKLVATAKKLDLPILVLSQLNRDCEKRDNKRPILQDLKESGDIEADAFSVFMLYRDEVYNKETDSKGIAELIVRKYRSGRLGFVKLAFNAEKTDFTDYGPQEEGWIGQN